MNTDPAGAPPRADLPFLRRRARPRPPAQPPSASASAASSTPAAGGPIDYSHHDRARHDAPAGAPAPANVAAPANASPPAAPAGPRPRIDFSRPDRRPPAAAPSAPAVPAPPADALDLSSTSTPASSPTAAAPRGSALRRHDDRHVAGREQVLLGVKEPTVTLSRVQSGVGHLSVEAVCSPEVGDLRLGAVYQFRSGGTSTVQLSGGNRFAPSSRRPVIVAGREEYERLSVDLRQIGDIERISVYAFSESRTPLVWGGTLVLDTFGGGRLELPLETLYSCTVAVLLSLYNLDGELVIRAEMESVTGDVREAARAYGYDRIAWRDDRSPVD